MKISQKFILALDNAPQPKYRIARAAGISPVLLWKLCSGYQPPLEKDQRLVRVGKVLGLRADEVFEREAK